MAEAPKTHRVSVKNNSEAPQGIHEARAASPDGLEADTLGAGTPATYIQPGAMRVVTVDQATLDHLKEHVSIFGVFPAPTEDEATDAAPTARQAAAEAAAPQKAAEDTFDAMSDDELRAFLTDRGQKPHNFAGRPKLLSMARGPADAGEQPDETV